MEKPARRGLFDDDSEEDEAYKPSNDVPQAQEKVLVDEDEYVPHQEQ